MGVGVTNIVHYEIIVRGVFVSLFQPDLWLEQCDFDTDISLLKAKWTQSSTPVYSKNEQNCNQTSPF